MNDRLKEIAKDAGVLGDWGEDVLEGRFFITGNTKQMKKFAELVAKECADLCDRFQARDVGMQPAECAAAIRKMFDVG